MEAQYWKQSLKTTLNTIECWNCLNNMPDKESSRLCPMLLMFSYREPYAFHGSLFCSQEMGLLKMPLSDFLK